MWFIGVEVEQQTSAPPPKKNPGSAPAPLNHPSKYKPRRSLYSENCPQIQSKTKKNGKFPSRYKASPIDFETQISLRR